MTEEPKGERAHPVKPTAVMASVPWEAPLAQRLSARFGADVLELASYLGEPFAVVRPGAVAPMLEFLKLEEEFEYLVDLTAVDHPQRAVRFDLVYILYSFTSNQRVRIKTHVEDGFEPATAVPVFAGANWLEREVFDMFGIRFAGHPDMRRILLPDEWKGFPLRKEYGITQMDNEWVQTHIGIESGQ